MATDFNFPTLEELVNRIQTDVQTQLPDSNPFLEESWLKAVIIGYAGRFYENYIQLQTVYNALFLPTSSNDFLENWGSVWSVTRLSATQSEGNGVATGTLGETVGVGTTLSTSNGISVEVQADATIVATSFDINIVREGTTVTVTPVDPADLFTFSNGQTITIAGADQTEYNGNFVIAIVESSEFTYTISTQPDTPATGAITAAADMAVMSLQSVNSGSDNNLNSGTTLTFDATITGIDTTAYVSLEGIEGAEDEESDDAYRARILSRVQNPVANFSVSTIEALAFEINGVTRVWVEPTTPDVGSVTVYFVRDGDDDIIPGVIEVLEVKENILTVLPATTDEAQVIVSGPTPVTVDFNFDSLVPNTTTMQAAIVANLQQYFTEAAGVATDILELAYNSAIYNTVDPQTGEGITQFTLSTPSADINIPAGEIGILGDVNF